MMRDDEMRAFVCCPYCNGTERLGYKIVPASERKWTENGEEFVEFWAESRDYKCQDCDFEFSTLMREEDYQ